ncbi:MAG: hypothetical protein ABLQ96_08590, partial [Candidatus Acidiferrum sp.]
HGYVESARQKATRVSRIAGNFLPSASAALAFALIEDSAQSQKLITQLEKDYPADTTVKYSVIPAVQALNLLKRNKAAEAVTALEAGRKYQLGHPASYGTYWVIYTRGLAYLQLRDGNKSAAEFQKVLDHRGLNAMNVLIPLSQLGLGRAYAQQGDTAKARGAYQDFFALWKDADPDVPVLLAAKAEYAKLNNSK